MADERILRRTPITHAGARRVMGDLAVLVGGRLEEVELTDPGGRTGRWLVVLVPLQPCCCEGCKEPAMLWLKMPELGYYFPADLLGDNIGPIGGDHLTLAAGFRFVEAYEGLCEWHLYLARPCQSVPQIDCGTGEWLHQPWVPGRWVERGWRDRRNHFWVSDIPVGEGMSTTEATWLYRQASEANRPREWGNLLDAVLA